MSRLTSLPARISARNLVGRRIYQIKCCGRYLRQKSVQSLLPTDEDPAVSYIILFCPVCGRELELELLLGKDNTQKAIENLGLDK